MKISSSWGLKAIYKVFLALQALNKPSTSHEVSDKLKTMLDKDDPMMAPGRLNSNYVSGMLYTLVSDKRVKLVHRGHGRWDPSIFICKERPEHPVLRQWETFHEFLKTLGEEGRDYFIYHEEDYIQQVVMPIGIDNKFRKYLGFRFKAGSIKSHGIITKRQFEMWRKDPNSA